MKQETKKARAIRIYEKHGIKFDGDYIYSPYGKIRPLLVKGNSKIGTGVYHFSTLPSNRIFHVVINGMSFDVKGTCPCTCDGCYALTGHYKTNNFDNSVIKSLAIKTLLVRNYLDFVKRAIIAQIEADNVEFCRIHASGDFDVETPKYITIWQEIVKECINTTFWTYTKNNNAIHAFDDFNNANIVKSVIKGKGFNYGHIDYIIALYDYLTEIGKSVYICRCGIDKNQHCTNCKACSKFEYVLFIEHSTDYKAESDPLYPVIVKLINSQESMER